jgi:hypothetical protein
MNWKLISLFLSLVLALILVYVVYVVVRVDNNKSIPPAPTTFRTQQADISVLLQSLQTDQLQKKFPFNEYLKTGNYDHPTMIQKDLHIMDSLYPTDLMSNQALLSMALTDSLYERKKHIFSGYQPDSLIQLIQWAEPYTHFSVFDKNAELLYMSVHDYWINKINNYISKYSQENSKVKYDFKFIYIFSRCAEKKMHIAPKVTYLEKVIDNIVRSQWGHLFEASWLASSFLQKVIFALFAICTLFAYFLFMLFIINKLKKKSS